MANFMGKDGFIWWQGVVEDRHDPLFLGRCRIRILGWHTKDKSQIPTESLPSHVPVPSGFWNTGSFNLNPSEMPCL